MRYVIQLDDGRFVKKSLMGFRMKPEFTMIEAEAEKWEDEKAAVAWCEALGESATVYPVDIPLESLVPKKPRVVKKSVEEKKDSSDA